MTNATTLSQQLHEAQVAEAEAEEERLAALRRATPDAQRHVELHMPERDFDPSWQEQQDFANAYRASMPTLI